MKLKIFIDKNREEEVIIYCKEKNHITDCIERLFCEQIPDFLGQNENGYKKLDLSEIFAFTVEDNKIFALLENDRYRIKTRLYQLEEILPENYIKINQSSIINLHKIDRFGAGFSGALTVTLKNGFSDYVSRRNVKIVKERLGV